MEIPAVSSRIQAVTVFHQGAAVTRIGELVPCDGRFPAQVKFSGLPLSLDDASIKARIEGDGSYTASAVDLRVALEISILEEDLPPAEDEALKQAQRERLRLLDNHEHLISCITKLEQLGLPPRPASEEGTPPAPSPTAQRLALLQFRREQLQKLIAQRLEIEQQMKHTELLCRDLQARKNAATNARKPREAELRKSIIVSLRSESGVAASARLLIEYLIPGARWAPAYSIQFNRELDRATLSIRAMVCQRSGEDWKDVSLTLSTARPQGWSELPELNSLRIGRFQPRQKKTGWRPPPSGTQDLFADFDRSIAAIQKPKELVRGISIDRSDAQPVSPQVTENAPEQALAIGAMALAGGDLSGEIALDEVELRPGATETRANMRAVPATTPPPAPPAAAPAPAMSQFEGISPPGFNAPAMSRVRAAVAGSAMPEAASKYRKSAESTPATVLQPADATDLTLLADEQMLQYGRLRMFGFNDRRRGSLVPVRYHEQYLETLSKANIHLSFNVVSVVNVAVNHAINIPQPPSRDYHYPETLEGFDYAYRAEVPLSIPSDDHYHALPLALKETDSRQHFVTVPRETQDVFRFAEIENPLDAPLLSGPIDIYINGDFLMTSVLNVVPTRGVLRMGLGVEQSIKVSRNTKFAEETAGLIGGSLNLKHEIVIDLINHLPQSANIEVRERIPVPREGDEQVKVTASATPPWEKYDPVGEDLKGGQRWIVNVASGKAKQLRAEYAVQIASKNELSGGNRREN